METGAITGYIDVAQLVLYGFWIFFAGLIIYLRREDKREGYPLESDRSDHVTVQGFPAIPDAKTFEMPDGRVIHAPSGQAAEVVTAAQPVAPWPGAPMEPVGDPMLAGVGPGSAATRANHPEPGPGGMPKIVPLRVATDYSIASRDPDPRGMPVVAADGVSPGSVTDAWIDLEEPQIRYLEVALEGQGGNVMVPMTLAKVDGARGRVQVRSLRAEHFANIPRLALPDQITMQEEENVVAYFGAGQLYATAERREPLI